MSLLFPEESSAAVGRRERRAFVLRKLFSLTGVVPIGTFLIAHLWTYSRALAGRHAFEQSLKSTSPYQLVIELLFVWLPILFHALYGLKVMSEARPNTGSYPYSKNWNFLLQRVTGVISLLFIGYHFWQFRLKLLLGQIEHEDVFPELCASLSSTGPGGIPFIALAYLLGVAAAAFHLASGLHGFCFSWGITATRRSSRLASTVFGLFGIVLFALGASSVIYFATGSRLVLSTDRPGASDAPAVGCWPRQG
jgi:succinate dehydrogenase/fumarate reductase cytochrome b subunit (b558 family)